jgi:hypothetical protein
LVLACPIAYLGKDDRIHLTDPQGAYDLSFDNTAPAFSVAWSPSGRSLGISTRATTPAICSTILNPMSGSMLTHAAADRSIGNFLVWTSEEQFYELGNNWAVYQRYVDSGAVLTSWKQTSDLALVYGTKPLPVQCAPMAFVCLAWRTDHSGYEIALLRKDLSIGRRISVPNRGAGSVCVDPLGEWVAWADNRSPVARLAVKRINDPPSIQPFFSEKEYLGVVACDWSEDGNYILAYVMENKYDWILAVFDRNARLVRTIPTAVPVQAGAPASWRKYGHR